MLLARRGQGRRRIDDMLATVARRSLPERMALSFELGVTVALTGWLRREDSNCQITFLKKAFEMSREIPLIQGK
jgi:hypothetical protein